MCARNSRQETLVIPTRALTLCCVPLPQELPIYEIWKKIPKRTRCSCRIPKNSVGIPVGIRNSCTRAWSEIAATLEFLYAPAEFLYAPAEFYRNSIGILLHRSTPIRILVEFFHLNPPKINTTFSLALFKNSAGIRVAEFLGIPYFLGILQLHVRSEFLGIFGSVPTLYILPF